MAKTEKGKKRTLNVRNPEQYEYAYLLFMQKVQQKDICKRIGISGKTLTDWKEKGGWEAKRVAKVISMDELITKTLVKISAMLDEDDFNADSFSKAVAQLKSLKSSNSVDDEIMCFMKFQDFLMQERAVDKSIDETFLKSITRYQDTYIQYRIGNGSR